MLAAGRMLAGGWLLVREAAALQAPVPARRGVLWDGRFRLSEDAAGCMVGALGAAASGLRGQSRLPAAVLWTLPAVWRDGVLAAVPHLRYGDAQMCDRCRPIFAPGAPLSGAPFHPPVTIMDDGADGNRDRGCQVAEDTPC